MFGTVHTGSSISVLCPKIIAINATFDRCVIIVDGSRIVIQNAMERQRQRLFSRLLCQNSARRMLRVKQRRQKRIREIRSRFDGIRRQQSAKKMKVMLILAIKERRLSRPFNPLRTVGRTCARYQLISYLARPGLGTRLELAQLSQLALDPPPARAISARE